MAIHSPFLPASRAAFSNSSFRIHFVEVEMHIDRLKWILLGIFLIVAGLGLLGLGLGSVVNIIAGICALVAGVLFIINR
jgi:hypothetical protein